MDTGIEGHSPLPEKGTDEYEAWLDGPRPAVGAPGRGQWLAGHSARAKQAKRQRAAAGEREGAEGGGRTVTLSEERERDVATLDAIVAAPKSLASDRIRAVEAKQRILAREEEAQAHEEHGALVSLRTVLDAIPTEQRVDALTSLLVVGDGQVGEGS